MRVKTLGYALCFIMGVYAHEDRVSFLDTCDITELKAVPIFKNCVKLLILIDLAQDIPDPEGLQQEIWYVVLMLSKEIQVFIESDYVLSEPNQTAIQAFLERLYDAYKETFAHDTSDYAIAVEKVLLHTLYQFHEMSVPN